MDALHRLRSAVDVRVAPAMDSSRSRSPKPKRAHELDPSALDVFTGTHRRERSGSGCVLGERAAHGERGVLLSGAQGFAKLHLGVRGRSKMVGRLKKAEPKPPMSNSSATNSSVAVCSNATRCAVGRSAGASEAGLGRDDSIRKPQ